MFKKIYDLKKEDGFYTKGYVCDSARDLIDELIKTDNDFEKVSITDDADVSFKTFGGNFSYSDFIAMYSDIRSKLESAYFQFYDNKGAVYFDVPEKEAILYTIDANMELNDLFEKKNKHVL